MDLASTDFYLIARGTGAGVVTLSWTEETSDMTDIDYRAALTRLGNIASEYRPSAILVDVSCLRHEPGESVEEWHRMSIIPEFNRAGLKKMAYAWGETAEVPPDPYPDPAEKFMTRNFSSREQAREWLLSY